MAHCVLFICLHLILSDKLFHVKVVRIKFVFIAEMRHVIFSIRYPPYEEKRFAWIRWLVEAKEQSYTNLSDLPPLLLSVPVTLIRKVGIPVVLVGGCKRRGSTKLQ